jgi:endonuclease/exonuclease/phosphatase family metal-dependent hydrolase
MKTLSYILIFSLVLCSCNKKHRSQEINIISFNIRFDNPNDGENSWSNRKEKVVALLKFHEANIVCLQEALHHQLIDLDKGLPSFSLVGVGRDDGKEQGEYSPILYDNRSFQLLNSGWFWLSETPDVPSLGWDAACIRICTWVKLKCLDGSNEFFVFNAHFDHIGENARIKSSQLIVNKIFDTVGNFPVVLTGDFNATPDSPAVLEILKILTDTYTLSTMPPYGPTGTWNAFDYNSRLDQRIDYIFVSKGFNVMKYANITDAVNQRFPSDHLPVFVRLKIE